MDCGLQILPDRIESEGVLLRRWLVTEAQALGRAVAESADHLRPWMAWMAAVGVDCAWRMERDWWQRDRDAR
jgi:hypothetical protein